MKYVKTCGTCGGQLPDNKYTLIRRHCLKCSNKRHAEKVGGNMCDGVVGSTANLRKMVVLYFQDTPYDRPARRENGD